MPINDNPDGYKVGGSHWSLLVLIKSENRFYYYDSMNNYNQAVAKVVCDKLTSYFSMQAKSKVTTLKEPAQENSYDCGIFTIIAVECAVQHLETHNTLDNFTFPCVTQLDCIKKKRSYMGYIAKNTYITSQKN